MTVVGAAGAAEAEEASVGAEVEVAASEAGAEEEEEGAAAAAEEEVAASTPGATGVVDGEGRRGTSQGRM